MNAASLFEEVALEAPDTEGIKYTGSKMKLLPYILELARKTKATTVLDGFSGTTRVSQAFAKLGYKVICNDIAVWSEMFGTCYLLNDHEPKHYESLIEHLNSVKPVDGWFTEHYGGLPNSGSSSQADGKKKPWQIHNTRKLDGIREEIDNLHLTHIERSVALTSLILALDKVDNTLGHFVSYLQDWSPRSYNEMVLRVPKVFVNNHTHTILRDDIFEVVKHNRVDLAYFDPPYGSNNDKMPPSRVRYASYYHVWTTICRNDRPRLFGKVNRRKDTSDTLSASIFEEFRKSDTGRFIAVEAIDRLIRQTNAEWVILSYSSGGRATAAELNDVLTDNGKIIEAVELDYRSNVMAGMKWTNEWITDVQEPNREFLFLLQK
ncbi:MAG TPA: DNA adenine methylase [Bacteroidota bacterium]